MEQKLTDQQMKFFSCLVGYINLMGYPPTVEEMRAAMRFKSPRSVTQYYEALERAGLIRRREGARNIQILKKIIEPIQNGNAKTVLVPIVGVVACGTPLLAEENLEGQVAVSLSLAKPSHRYFILKAKGDSMNRSGIDDGDLVLVRQQPTAEGGDRVVALIDDDATIKRFRRSKESVVLEPESSNPEHNPIVLEKDFQIQGVVIQVLDTEKGRDAMAKYNRNTGKEWSTAEINQMKQLARENTPTRVIGLKLGRTPDAIYTKASEKGISLSPTNQSPYERKK